MRKAERIEQVSKLSREYAQSGDYSNWYSIEQALRRQGFPEARTVLDSKYTRDQLDEMCKFAQAAKARGLTYAEAVKEAQSRL